MNSRVFQSVLLTVLKFGSSCKNFSSIPPRLVLGIGDKTPMASPDHAQAVAITEAAVFYSRLTKWDDVFDHLPVHKFQSPDYFCLRSC